MSDQGGDPRFLATHTLIVGDVARSVAFYRDVLGGTVLREGAPTMLRLANIWIILNVGGGPTGDKPDVVAAPPPRPMRRPPCVEPCRTTTQEG